MLYSFALVGSLVHFIFINSKSFKTRLKRTLYVYQKFPLSYLKFLLRNFLSKKFSNLLLEFFLFFINLSLIN